MKLLALAALAGAVTSNLSRVWSPTAFSFNGCDAGETFQSAGACNSTVPDAPDCDAVASISTERVAPGANN